MSNFKQRHSTFIEKEGDTTWHAVNAGAGWVEWDLSGQGVIVGDIVTIMFWTSKPAGGAYFGCRTPGSALGRKVFGGLLYSETMLCLAGAGGKIEIWDASAGVGEANNYSLFGLIR